ncbi:MAG TPA: cyclopropane-fatty-acyl-phospholipid synthase family protein [Terriglobales bacterium]|nr:cyclopropane-fatty-acyl-phospholipid synthase family protein [Terriglobales bacterium]
MVPLTKSLFASRSSLISAEFLENVLAEYPRRDFQVRFWDGTTWGAEKQPGFTLVLKHPEALPSMCLSPSELSLGESYIYGDFDIEGDLEAAFDLADYLLGQERSLWERFDLAERLRELPPNHYPRPNPKLGGSLDSRDRDRRAISYHYDLPAEFYALWLDQHMVHSCAYFNTPLEELDAAQQHKLDSICRQLRLCPGEHLLDIGCGWGALLMHAAVNYGVQAVGITRSVPQAEVARQRLREAGLNDRCRVEVSDYHDIDQDQQYDKIVSVGVLENIGEALLPVYFRQVWALLRPGAVFLNQVIASSANYPRSGPSCIDRYMFRNAEPTLISTNLRAAELADFEVRDVEGLREHYAATLHHWIHRLEARAEEARRITDDITYRIWRLCMAGCAHAFRSGRLNAYETVLAKPLRADSGLLLTGKSSTALHL